MRLRLNILLQLFLFLVAPVFVKAEIKPKDKAVIYHAQILFEFKPIANAHHYQVVITQNKKNYHKQTSEHPTFICNKIFDFGKTYSWKVIAYTENNIVIPNQQQYSFTLAKLKRADPTYMHIDITKYDTLKCASDLILMDNNTIITRNGKVVFGIDSSMALARDLTLTPQSTLTFLDSLTFFEMDLNRKVLWKSPKISNDTMSIVEYHHDMQKTSYGTYLCMAIVSFKKIKQQSRYTALIEFDKNNNIKWFWSEKDFYPNDSNLFRGSHANSIDYDEKTGVIYMSNRDLSSIIKIDKKSGNILYSIGYNFGEHIAFYENNLFKMQHRVTKLQNGNFLIFNNDSGQDASVARTKIIEITDPETTGGQINLEWEYVFNFDSEIENYIPRMGGVILTKQSTLLISTGVLDRVFEVTREGEIIWEGRFSRTENGQEAALPCYRSNAASSLFPYSHMCYTKVTGNSKQQVLVNTGSENDTYEITNEKGNKQIVILKAGTSFALPKPSIISIKSITSNRIVKFTP